MAVTRIGKEIGRVIGVLKKNINEIKFSECVKKDSHYRYMFTYRNIGIIYFKGLEVTFNRGYGDRAWFMDEAYLNGVPVDTKEHLEQLRKILFDRLYDINEEKYMTWLGDFQK